MERVTFLIESSGERISAMLNPESVVVRRTAGITTRRAPLGRVIGARLSDDPLLYAGGGRTELELELLFDVGLAGSTSTVSDALALTAPLRMLGEHPPDGQRPGEAAILRFVWGKSWNVPCVVLALSERFEHFTATGAPRRAWMRMRLRRVNPPPHRAQAEENDPLGDSPLAQAAREILALAAELSLEELVDGALSIEVTPDTEVGRLDLVAQSVYGNPFLWPLVAAASGLSNPLVDANETGVVTAPSIERVRANSRERREHGTSAASP